MAMMNTPNSIRVNKDMAFRIIILRKVEQGSNRHLSYIG